MAPTTALLMVTCAKDSNISGQEIQFVGPSTKVAFYPCRAALHAAQKGSDLAVQQKVPILSQSS